MPQLDTRHAISAALVAIAVLLGVASFGSFPGAPETPVADAHGGAGSNPGDLLGFAWSSNFGWLSFSCENNPNSCAAGDWGVTIDAHGAGATGNMDGYAWGGLAGPAAAPGSPKAGIGWVSFKASSAVGCGGPAHYDVANKKLTGYARACVAVNDCVNPTALNPAAGGWDGCINLDPPAPGGDIGLTNRGSVDTFEGYAWDASAVAGGPIVGIGWLDFCPVGPGIGYDSCVHLRTKLSTGLIAPTLSASPNPVTAANPKTTLTWFANDPAYDSCTEVPNAGGFSTGGAVSGSDQSVDLTALAPVTFQISCTDTATAQTNLSNSVTVQFNAASIVTPPACSDGIDNETIPDGLIDAADPGCKDSTGVYDPNDPSEEDVTATFTVTPSRVNQGGNVTADWNITGGGVSSCTLTQSGVATPPWNISPALPLKLTGPQSIKTSIPVVDRSQTTFTLKCVDGGGGLVLTRVVRILLNATPKPN